MTLSFFSFLKIVAAAKEVTGISDNETEAVIKFKQKLNSSEMYYNTQPIPKNESDEEAHKKCRDIEGAKKYCPKRWEALQLWIADSRKVLIRCKSNKKNQGIVRIRVAMCFDIYNGNGNGRVADIHAHSCFLFESISGKKPILRRLISRSWICKSFLLS